MKWRVKNYTVLIPPNYATEITPLCIVRNYLASWHSFKKIISPPKSRKRDWLLSRQKLPKKESILEDTLMGCSISYLPKTSDYTHWCTITREQYTAEWVPGQLFYREAEQMSWSRNKGPWNIWWNEREVLNIYIYCTVYEKSVWDRMKNEIISRVMNTQNVSHLSIYEKCE